MLTAADDLSHAELAEVTGKRRAAAQAAALAERLRAIGGPVERETLRRYPGTTEPSIGPPAPSWRSLSTYMGSMLSARCSAA